MRIFTSWRFTKRSRFAKSARFVARADAARDARRTVVAAVLYEEALRINPRNAGIHIQCGHMHKESGNYAAAGRHYAEAERLMPDDADLHLQLGHFHKLQGAFEQAREAYARAIVLAPEWLEPQHELTRLVAGHCKAPGAHILSAPQQPEPSMISPLIIHAMPSTDGRLYGNFEGFDGIACATAVGWAWNPDRPSESAEVEFIVDGMVVASCKADLKREDVAKHGIGTGASGFRCKLPSNAARDRNAQVHARIKNGPELQNSPQGRHASPKITRWLARRDRLSKRTLSKLRTRLDRATEGRLLSIVVPVYNTRADWLRCMLDSVRAQWCGRWELICVDDCSTEPRCLEILREYAARDPRIQVVESEVNQGIACATNLGIKRASGDYIALADHDDYLEPDAVYKLLQAGRDGAELIYSDELITQEDIDVVDAVAARPAFSYDYYLSHPYFVHLVCIRRDIALAIGGWDERLKISGDVDFVLRVIERATKVAHVASVLYRWRTHTSSAGQQARDDVMATTAGIIRDHLRRIGSTATVKPGLGFNQFRTDFPDAGGKTLVVIPTRDRIDLLRPCIESIETTTSSDAVKIVVIDHESKEPATRDYLRGISDRHIVMPYHGIFNYSAMNNLAVQLHGEGCRHVLFANNDIEATQPGWLESMRRLASRPDVGCVGATLTYADETIQHAGVIIGINGLADHAHRGNPLMTNKDLRCPGHLQSLVSVRDYSAVTAACMMVPLAIFNQVGGFDERQVVGFNDTDLCLRIGEAGYKVLMDPYAVLFHYESATRSKSNQLDHPDDSRKFQQTWRTLLDQGDPFYNPMLDLRGPDHKIGLTGHNLSRIGQVRVIPVVLPKQPVIEQGNHAVKDLT